MLNHVNPSRDELQVIFLTSTRHSAIATLNMARSIPFRQISFHLAVNESKLTGGPPHVVIGTPLEVVAYLNSENLLGKSVGLIIFDEANKSMSFKKVRSTLFGTNAQKLCISSTLTQKNIELARSELNAVVQLLPYCNQINRNVRHVMFHCKNQAEKLQVLKAISCSDKNRILVFVQV